MKAIPIVFCLFSVLLLSCNRSNFIRIESTNFHDEVEILQNLEFTFNHALVGDSMLNIWDSIPYLTFEPAIKGKFRWEKNNLLVFSPEKAMLAATDYSAKPTKLLTKYLKRKKTVENKAIEFHTPYLNINSFSAYWTIANEQLLTTELRLSIEFNYPVEVNNIPKLLILKLKGKVIPYKVITVQNGAVVELNIPKPEASISESIPGMITIAEGLACAQSNSKTNKKIEYSFEIPPQDQLTITELITGYEGGSGFIRVLTTQPVVNKDLKSLLKINPNLDFSAENIENGILIKGDFLQDNSYTVTVSGQLKGIFGKEMGEDYTETVKFGDLSPYISFTDNKAIYLSSKGSRNIAVNIVNVPRIKLTIFKVFENNIMHYMGAGEEWDYYYDDEDNWYDFTTCNMNEKYGRVIYTKEIQSGSLAKKGNVRLLNMDLNNLDLNSEFKGIYVIKVEALDSRWLVDSRIISVSDIGLIAKKGINNLFIMTTSIKTAEPLTGVKVNLISKNNQKVMTLTTNNMGVAIVEDLKKAIPDFEVGMITTNMGNDFNFMFLEDSRIEDSRFEVGGKRTEGIDYDVFVYGPRNLYRPGDSVFYNLLVRDFQWKSIRNALVKVKIILPTGKEYLSFKKELSDQGSAQFAFRINPDLITGVYSFEVYSGNDVLLQSCRFGVEEFIPDRIKVNVKIPKSEYLPSQEMKVNVLAENMFGPPATNRNVEVTMKISKKAFLPKNLPEYNFSVNQTENSYFPQVVNQTKTNVEGKAEAIFTIPEHKNIGILQGSIYTTVFDETGRPVNRLNTFEVLTQYVFYGIKNSDCWVSTRKPVHVSLVAVDKNGKLLSNVSARVQVRRIFWETVLERYGSRYYYNSQKREKMISNKSIILSGQSSFTFTPTYSGQYEIRIMPEEGAGFVSQTLYAYGWGDTDFSSFEVNREGEITIEPDKNEYKVGETAKILFKAPFSGNLIVTVEKDKVVEQYNLKTDNKAASLNIPITSNHLPNIYISATGIRELKDDGIPLTVAHGITNLTITDQSRKLDIQITSPASVRSKSKQTIKIKTVPNARVTLAIVDEGILSLTNYKTPDPFGFYYGKRALEVNSYDIFARLYPELRTGSSKTGGSGMEDLGKRMNPFTSKRIRLVSFWSGEMKSNSAGECTFTVDIPQFSGAVRIMAVAYKNENFGSAEKEMKVSDPIVISPALPRFLSPGDKITMPVTLTNTTAGTAAVTVSVTVKGPLSIVGKSSQNITLKANAEGRASFSIDASGGTGYGSVIVSASCKGEKFSDETEITVRPSAGLLKKTGIETIKGGTSKIISNETDFMPGTASSKIIITKSPIAAFTKDISYLLSYPYGCLEQTISAAFPQIYYRELAMAIHSDNKGVVANPDYHVQEAINKIQSMQQYNGGIAYWPGGENINWWGSAYAAHFLYEARKAGYEINQSKYESLLKFLEKRAKDKATDVQYYYDMNNRIQQRNTAARETFYTLFILALEGKANHSLMNYYKAHLDELSTDSRYMLAGAYHLSGDKVAYQAVIPKDFGIERSLPRSGGSFYSYIRDIGISLYVMMEVDPENPQVASLSKRLSEQMKIRPYLSTQERIFAILALGKIAKRAALSDVSATIYINGKEEVKFTGKDLVIRKPFLLKDIKVVATGSGNVYCFYETEGVSASGEYTEEDNTLLVRKNFFDRNGNLLSGNTFAQNDLVVVELSLHTKDNSVIENVAITDMLPACFEIENPRLNTERDFPWIKNKSIPDYLDIRDDRINFFTSANGQTRTFYYTVRVVSSGTYKMGPVSADAMYNGEYHSYWGARNVTVK